MKNVLHIIFLFCCFSSFGQEWRDSLSVAREAYKKEDYGKALKYYESAQKKAPDNVDLSDEMAQSAYKAREFERAEKIYQQSSGAKKSKQAQADTYHNMGNARMKKKDYSGAIDSYKESLRLNPNDDQTRYNLSEAIRKLKQEQKKDQNQQNQQDQQDQQNNQNQNQQNQQNQNNQNGNQQSQSQQNQNSQQSESGNSEQQEQSKLPNKQVDRMLDKLMKDEAETKRKMNGTKGKNNSPRSGKDW